MACLCIVDALHSVVLLLLQMQMPSLLVSTTGHCRCELIGEMYQHLVMFSGWQHSSILFGNVADINLQICAALYSSMSQNVSSDSHMSSCIIDCVLVACRPDPSTAADAHLQPT